MTENNTLNVKLSNLQLNQLKSGIKNGTKVTLNLWSNVIGDSNDENDFPHNLLLTDTQVSRIYKAFANDSSSKIKSSKNQLSKNVQLTGFLGISGPFLKSGLSLMKNVLKPRAKSVLLPLGLTAASSAADARTNKKILGSGMTAFTISNKEMDNIMKIVKSLEDSGLLIKSVSKTIKNEAKERKGEFLSMLLRTLGATLLGNLLTGKKVKAKIPVQGVIRAGEGTIRAP